MNLIQHLLGKLAEECTEVGHVAHKAQQFGLNDAKPDSYQTNQHRLHDELDDLLGVVEALNRHGFNYTPDAERVAAKSKKVGRYLGYSCACGMVDKEAFDEYHQELTP